MGFIRRGNYENNTVDGIIQIVNGFVRSKTEATNYSGRTPEESRDFSQMFIQLMSKTNLIIEGKCYIGITANPIGGGYQSYRSGEKARKKYSFLPGNIQNICCAEIFPCLKVFSCTS